MTASDLARMFHGRKAGHYKGRPAWQAKCPIHRDRSPSLSITEPERGRAKVHCFRGCDDEDVLAAKGLVLADLYADKTMDPAAAREWEQRKRDEDRLAILEHRHGLFIMLQAVETDKRRYWEVAERNCAVEIQGLRDRMRPSEKEQRDRAVEVQRVIAEYGFEELMECLPPNLV